MSAETVKSIGTRILEKLPDVTNTKFWFLVNISNPNIDDETRALLSALMKRCEYLIPIGSVRVVRKLREEAREGKESIKLLPSAERQQVIDQEEKIYHEKYSKNKGS
jgi:hypothetical protein